MKMGRIWNATAIGALFCMAGYATIASAQDVLLTVTVDDVRHEFSLDDLKDFPVSTIETTTIWTDGLQVFEGVAVQELLDSLGVTEGTIKATAINEYEVDIPVSDIVENGPVVAYSNNGQPMLRREKGPLWIVYPYDSDRAYQTKTIYNRSIWQLDRLEINR